MERLNIFARSPAAPLAIALAYVLLSLVTGNQSLLIIGNIWLAVMWLRRG